MFDKKMEYLTPFIQAVITSGVGACIGWYLCKRSVFVRPKVVSNGAVRGNVKLVLVVRTDLSMGKGKVAAQVMLI